MNDNKETVKLIIEIPKNYLETIKHTVRSTAENGNAPLVFEIIANGIPLDSVKAEIEKQIERDFAFAEMETLKVPYHYGIANGLQNAIRFLDNIGKTESEG